jgi:hypothetical protein
MDSADAMVVDPVETFDDADTGFRPDDARQLAPERVEDAAATFSSISRAPVVKHMGGDELLTEAQQRENRKELQGILRAQRIAETLTGVGGR